MGFSVVIAASIIILACQKELSSPKDISTKFDDKAAKEWYYGTFKKSPEYAGYNAAVSGKKLPDWKHGKSMRFGNYLVADFPLVKQKSSVTFPASSGLTDADKRRVAEASFSRMAFIKDNTGRIDTREIQFIPDMDYLVRHNYDISTNSFAQMDKDYSGFLVVKTWNGSEISRSIISNGKIIKRLKKHNSNITIPGGRIQDMVCIIEWARDCDWEEHGDQGSTWECGEWYPTGNQWCWDDGQSPPEGDPCSDPGSPQCNVCAFYGIGCEQSGGGEEQEVEYIKRGTSVQIVYVIDPGAGGGTCKVTQELFGKFHRIHSENDHINSCYYTRSDIINNSLGATSAIYTYNVTNLGSYTITVATAGNVNYPDQSYIPFTGTNNISMGDVTWHL